jgi:hypothetical protein
MQHSPSRASRCQSKKPPRMLTSCCHDRAELWRQLNATRRQHPRRFLGLTAARSRRAVQFRLAEFPILAAGWPLGCAASRSETLSPPEAASPAALFLFLRNGRSKSAVPSCRVSHPCCWLAETETERWRGMRGEAYSEGRAELWRQLNAASCRSVRLAYPRNARPRRPSSGACLTRHPPARSGQPARKIGGGYETWSRGGRGRRDLARVVPGKHVVTPTELELEEIVRPQTAAANRATSTASSSGDELRRRQRRRRRLRGLPP